MKRIFRMDGYKTALPFLFNGLLLILIFLFLLPLKGAEHSPPTFKQEVTFTEYHFKRLGVRLSFPSSWKVSLKPFAGEEVFYTLTAEGEGATLLVQGWKMKDLKGFIDTSLLTAPSIDAVSVLPYESGGYSGYFLAYRQHLTKKKVFVREILLRTGRERVTRFVLIMGEEPVGEMERLFRRVVQSYRQDVSPRAPHG